MRTTVILTIIGLGVACQTSTSRNGPTALIVTVPPPTPPSAASAAQAPPPKAPPMRALVLGGPRAIANAAWTPDGAVAVTESELWRFRPEDPDVIHTTPLIRPASVVPVLAVAPSGRIAVSLDDADSRSPSPRPRTARSRQRGRTRTARRRP